MLTVFLDQSETFRVLKTIAVLRTWSQTIFVETSDAVISVPEIVQYDPSSRFECFTASKGSNNYFYLLLLQLVLCRVAALKSLPVHHP